MNRIALRCQIYLALLAIVTGCSDSPMNYPTVADLAGTYTLSQSSQAFLVSKKSHRSPLAASIVLNADRSVVVNAMPDAYIDAYGLGKAGSVSGRGTWELESANSGYGINLDIDGTGSMPKALYSGTSIRIKGRRAPYRIEVQLGDPDSRESITFEKSGAHL